MNRLFARRSALILAAIFILGLVLVFAGPRQSGPVLTVNGEEVSTGRFETDYRAAQLAYGRLAQTPPPLREIQAAVLTQLIESSLIRRAVREELGSESDVLVSARVERYRGDAELRRAAEALYGMEFEIFVEEILAPQAEKDILAGRLYLQGKEFSDWLAEAKRSARVVLALEGFRWTGERVEWAD